jgi:hypothetical protein
MALGRALSVLVHGPAKVGKSTLASTSPKPLCFLDAEGGTRFLPINAIRWDPLTEEPPVPDGTWDTAVVTVRDFDTVVRAFAWFQSGKHHFKSVAMDSASEIQQRLIEKVTGRGQAQQQQWGEILRTFIALMRDFRDLAEHPVNPLEAVILVAMTKQGGDGLYHPWFQGQTQTMIPYLFDVVAAMTAFTYTPESGTPYPVHRLLIGPNNLYEVGERAGGRLPAYIDNPTVVGMLDSIFGPAPSAV